MKKILFISQLMTIFILSALMVSCTSKEKNAAETIKDKMFKTLYDFESYQPVETKIDTLKQDKYGDTLIYDNIMLAETAVNKFNESKKNFDEQYEIAQIYEPTRYSSSSSDKKFYAARDKMQEYIDDMDFYNSIIDSLCTQVRNDAKKSDGKPYGWLVTHKFRCKTKGGNPELSTYVYFMDTECKTIYRYFDEDDMTYEKYKENVDAAMEMGNNKK